MNKMLLKRMSCTIIYGFLSVLLSFCSTTNHNYKADQVIDVTQEQNQIADMDMASEQQTDAIGVDSYDQFASEENIQDESTEEVTPADNGWTKVELIPEFDIEAIYGNSLNSLYIAGTNGNLIFFNGSSFFPLNSGTNNSLFALSGQNSSVFAAGEKGVVLKLVNNVWKQLDSGVTDTIRSIAMTGENSFYAAGDNGLIIKFDGTDFVVENQSQSLNLYAIYASDSGEPIACGQMGSIMKKVNGVWAKQLITADTVTLRDIVGSSESNIFVAGDLGKILFYNNIIWKAETTNDPDNRTINDMILIGADDLFAVGLSGLILHRLKNKWSMVEPEGPYNAGANLNALFVEKKDDKYIGIAGGNKKAILLNSYGTAWKDAEIGSGFTFFDSVNIGDKGTFFAGSSGMLLKYKDNRFTSLNFDSSIDFYSITYNKKYDVIMLGGTNALYKYDFSTNQLQKISLTGVEGKIKGIAGDMFCGESGILGQYNYDDGTIKLIDSGVYSNLNAIVKNSLGSYYIAGDNGVLLKITQDTKNNKVSKINLSVQFNLNGITEFKEKIYIAGDGGCVLEGVGDQFDKIKTSPGDFFYDVRGIDGFGLVVTGYGGAVLRFDNNEFIPLNSPSAATYMTIVPDSETNGFIVAGIEGIIFKYNLNNSTKYETETF